MLVANLKMARNDQVDLIATNYGCKAQIEFKFSLGYSQLLVCGALVSFNILRKLDLS